MNERTALREGAREVFFGGLRIACERPDGTLHGRVTLVTRDGERPIESWTYREGVRHGPMIGFHESGKPAVRATFEAGALHGVVTMWDADGRVLSERRYEHGKPLER